MPLDPSIILQGSNPNAAMLQEQQQIAGMKAAQQQRQLANYQVLQAKSDFEDQQNLKSAWRQAGGDPTKTMAIASQLGVSPKTLQAYQVQQLNLQKQHSDIAASDATTNSKNFETLQNQTNRLYEIGSQRIDELKDPATFAQARDKVLGQAKTEGVLSGAQAEAYRKEQPQDFIDGIYHLRSLKEAQAQATLDQTDATTKKNAADTDLAKSQQAVADANVLNTTKAQWASKLEQAYTQAGGGVSGARALDALRHDAPETVKNFLPTGQQIAQIAGQTDQYGRDGAITAIRYAGMDNEQKQKADESARNEQQLESYQKQELVVRKQEAAASHAMAQANLALKQQGVDDRQIQQLSAPFVKLATNAQTQLGNINQAITQLNSKDGATQFMGLLSTLKADVAGGGVRLNNSEYEGVLRSRLGGKYTETMQQVWTGQPLSQGQVDALKGAMSDLKAVVAGKMNDAANAMQDISTAPNQATRQGKVQWYVRNKFGMEGTQPNTSGSAPKVASMSDIQDFAKRNNISVDAARQQAIQEGFKVK